MIETTSEEELPLDEHSQLKYNLTTAKESLLHRQNNCTKIKKDLSKEEDLLVEASEAVRTATEELRVYEHTKVTNIVDEDLREIEIARLKASLPELLKRLENEAPIILKDLMMEEDSDDDEDDTE